MLVGSGIIPPTIATVSSISAAASLASSAAAQRRSPVEIKEEQTENGRRDQEEQVDVVKTDQPVSPPITRKRKMIDLDRLANESKGYDAKVYEELNAYSKRIKFDTLATNQSHDNQFLSTSSNRTNGQAADYPANLCYS